MNMQPKTTGCRNFFPLQTANVAYFRIKIQLSGWLAVPINPDKWRSTVLLQLFKAMPWLKRIFDDMLAKFPVPIFFISSETNYRLVQMQEYFLHIMDQRRFNNENFPQFGPL
jgi:hypothetical protein